MVPVKCDHVFEWSSHLQQNNVTHLWIEPPLDQVGIGSVVSADQKRCLRTPLPPLLMWTDGGITGDENSLLVKFN